MQAGQPRGRVAQAIESLVLVENHLSDLERHSTAQVNQLQQEQEVLASAADYADQGPADLPAAFENLLGFQQDVKTLQKDFYRMQKEHDSFVKV